MNRKSLIALSLIAFVGLAIVVASSATADQPKDAQPAGHPEMKLPPGWTPEDMQACMQAMTPGKMHEYLAKGVGVWHGKSTFWMYPGAEPVSSESTSTLKPMMDGRYVKCEVSGEMPGMGPFNGFGIYGFDNVAQKFVATWIDNCGTGLANGTGELSSDGKVLTWTYTYNCPIRKGPTTLREVHTNTGPNSQTMEIFGTDPKSGKEFKMMQIELTRKPGTEGTAATPTR